MTMIWSCSSFKSAVLCLPGQHYSELISIGETSDVVNYKVLDWNTKQLQRGKIFEMQRKKVVDTEKLQRSLCLQFNTEYISINVFQSFNQNISSTKMISLWCPLVPSAVEMKWSVSGGKVGMAAARWDSNKVVQEVIKFVLNPGLDRRDRGTTNKIFYFNEIKFYCLHCLSLSLSKWYIR